MTMEKPEVQFLSIDLSSEVLANSDPCTNCATSGGTYRGGGQTCFGDDSVSTECGDPDSHDLS